MKKTGLYIFISIVTIFANCKSNQYRKSITKLNGTNLNAYGRFDLHQDGTLELISAASYTGVTFSDEEIIINASIPGSNQHNYLQYELDGNYIKRLKIVTGPEQNIIIKAGKGKHKLKIYKATEATTGPVFIHSIAAKNLAAIAQPEKQMIEFIGNSITCGAASDESEVPCGQGFYHDQHNAYKSYGPRVAAMLGVNYILSCVSGIGIYRNWNSDGPVMQDVYEKLSLTETDKRNYDFNSNIPEIVSIALGTNDFSKGDGIKARLPFDSMRFTNNYIQFIKLVKSKYPEAKIALLTSPAVGNENAAKHYRYLLHVKTEIDAMYPASFPVSVFAATPIKTQGCTGHPGVEDHASIAKALVPFFRQLLQ